MSANPNFDSGIDPTWLQALTATIETSINAALAYDPASRQKIASIQDILAIESTLPSLCLYIQGQESGVRVLSYCETPVSTHLTGSPLALLNLLKQPSSLANSGVNLVGSTQLLQQWQEVMHTLDIDWEDAISSLLGDIAGPITTKTAKSSAEYAKQQFTEQGRLIAEYLPEELKLTPSQPEAEQFFEQVDRLKLDVDRMTARIQALHNKLAQEDGTEKSS